MGAHSTGKFRATRTASAGANWNDIPNIYDSSTSTYAYRSTTATSATHINGFNITVPSGATVTSIEIHSKVYANNENGYIYVYLYSDEGSTSLKSKSVVDGAKFDAAYVTHTYTTEEIESALTSKGICNGSILDFLPTLRVRFVIGSASSSVFDIATCRVYDNYVVVNYTIPDYKLTVKATEGGTVSNGGTYEYGSTVTATATPNNGYKFSHWLVNGVDIGWTNPIFSCELTENTSVTAVFEEIYSSYVTYDSVMNFQKWKDEGVTVTNGVASDITDTGLTLTTNADKTSSRTSSPFFPVEYGKSYKIDIDIEGADWTVYIFFCDADENRIDFKDSTHKFSSSGAGVPSRIFTAPDNPSVVQAQIRLDCRGGGGGTATYSNFRIFPAECEYMSNTVDESERVDYGLWSMPTPVRSGYEFIGWNTEPDGGGTAYTSESTFPTDDLTLYSQWKDMSKVYCGTKKVSVYCGTQKVSVYCGTVKLL